MNWHANKMHPHLASNVQPYSPSMGGQAQQGGGPPSQFGTPQWVQQQQQASADRNRQMYEATAQMQGRPSMNNLGRPGERPAQQPQPQQPQPQPAAPAAPQDNFGNPLMGAEMRADRETAARLGMHPDVDLSTPEGRWWAENQSDANRDMWSWQTNNLARSPPWKNPG
jgi:hypothetical protein